MKFWIRIIVAVVAILIVGFAVWAFFIKEKDEVQAYGRLCEMVDYKQSIDINGKIEDLRKNNLMGKDSQIIPNETDAQKNIYKIRENCFSEELIIGYSDSKVIYSYKSLFETDKYVSNIIEYYLPYVNGDRVNSKSLNNLKKNITAYIKSIEDINESIDNIVAYQKVISGTSTEMGILEGRYKALYSNYRNSLNKSANLILSIIDYIDVSVYSDKLKIDVFTAISDAYARALVVSTTVDEKEINNFSNDVNILENVIDEYKNDVNLFNSNYTEYDFLISYNKLHEKYKDVLNYVFSRTTIEKRKMADGENLSSVYETAKDSVITILNILGFEGEV